MADNELNDVGGGGDIIFVYTGGDQEVPRDVKRVRIAENVDTIPARTFEGCQQLIEVEGHNKINKIEEYAFHNCRSSLRRVTNMQDLIEIERSAFSYCYALSDIDFDKLEIIGDSAFAFCYSLMHINMPSIRRVGAGAFRYCGRLKDAVFGVKLERFEGSTFFNCSALTRIVIPLKDNLIINNNAFLDCENFASVNALDGGIHTTIFNVDALAGGIRKTISSLHLEEWRNEMEEEIDRINQTLPNIRSTGKARATQDWITTVFSRMEHYKTEHQTLLKKAMTLLELALWKAKLLNETDDEKKCNVDEVTKRGHRVTCGASIVIKNVLPFLALK